MVFDRWSRRLQEGFTCDKLWHELLVLVHGQRDTAERLLTLEKQLQPGKPESWYLDKVVYDLRRDTIRG